MQLAFAICLLLALITLPLRDIITIGFYDVSDFFVSGMISFFVGYIVSNQTMLTTTIFIVIYIAVTSIVILLNIFIIIPFRRRSENSSATSIHQLAGKEGTVSIPITFDGIGEVVVYTGFSKTNRMAKIYKDKNAPSNIKAGENVLVIEIKDSILYVQPYANSIKAPLKLKPTWNQLKK